MTRQLWLVDMAKAIGRAVGRSVKVVPIPIWLFMKAARMGGLPIDLISGVRYYIDDHKRGAFELGAPTTDVFDETGQPAEDFETIARRYAALLGNRRTPGNWLRQFAQFVIAPVSPGFDLERYDRELRRPFPSEPQLRLSPRSGCASMPWLTRSETLLSQNSARYALKFSRSIAEVWIKGETHAAPALVFRKHRI